MISFMKSNASKQLEKGSIMLEVIAVLALMGVMGAMLFRQIYQRNQELHNIQMASEMRTIKEAFSAYIQAERSILLSDCAPVDCDPSESICLCDGLSSNTLAGERVSGDLTGVQAYLPDGWFCPPDGGTCNPELWKYYHFSLWTYRQSEATQKTILYGVIIPKQETLPSPGTGWNFKRAARVALLIGADGGVYGSDITELQIAGALGTWHLPMVYDSMCRGVAQCPDPTYVAITPMDIFTPEYELPDGKVGLREDWILATKELHAWDKFSAGSQKNCFDVDHDEMADNPLTVKDDHDKGTCHPLFVVDNFTKKVSVNTDLEIGPAGTVPALTIRQEGPIVYSATTTDPQNSADVSYLLDPQYTSVMNDVKIMSRGGAKLSEILPKYILRDSSYQTVTGNSLTVPKPSTPACPEGYTEAFTVSLVDVGATREENAHTHNVNTVDISSSGEHTHTTSTAQHTIGSTTTNDVKYYEGTSSLSDGHTHAEPTSHTHSIVSSGAHTHTVPAHTTQQAGNLYVTNVPTITRVADTESTWEISIERHGASGDPTIAYQTYCVWDGMIGINTTRKTGMETETTWDTFKGRASTQAECLAYGGTWNAGSCE